MKPSYLAVLSGTVAALSFWTANAPAETLPEAISYMLLSHPEIRAQSYNRAARENEVRQAKAGYLPTIDAYLTAGFDRQHTPATGTSWPQSTTVSLRQNVFRFFGTQSEVERQEARARSQEHLVQSSAESNALLGARAFINLLRNQELLDLAQENLTNHLRILDQVKLRSESGVDRRSDLDQVVGRVALAQSNLVAAKANLEDSATDYKAVIGHVSGALTPPGQVAPLPGSLEEAERAAVENHPTLKSALADLEARQAQHSTAKSQLYPSLDLAVDYKWQKDVGSIAGRTEDFLAMMTVSFNIFNGGWNKARLGQTSVEVNEAQEIANNTRRQVIQSIRLSWEFNNSTGERVKYLDEYVKASGKTAESYAAQWNIGRRTMLDLLDTQAEFINARASYTNAKYDKMYAEYRVLNGMSRLLPSIGLQLDPGSAQSAEIRIP